MIDVDFAPNDRDTVYNHMIETFGEQYTAYILAIGTVSDKGCIDEIGRAMHREFPNDDTYSLENIKIIKKEYDEQKNLVSNDLSTLQKKLKDKEISQEEYYEEWNNLFKPLIDKYPKIFYYFLGLLDTKISQSMHPCGMVVSPITLADNYGILYRDGKKILQIDMDDVHEVSLVKYDILGLKNVEIIKDACEEAGIPYPRSHEINWNDQKVWQDMLRCPQGIFQFEGTYAFQMLCEFKPKNIFDMSLVTAALRPSGASYRDGLMKKQFHHNISPIIDELLKDNYGYLVYQCIPEDEYVNTIFGRKYIKDCVEGELVYTQSGIHKINKVIPKKNNEIINIKTKNSNMRCTKDHKVLTNRGWVEAKDLQLTDSIAYRVGGNTSSKTYDINWLKVIGWYLGDGWVTHKPKIVYMINRDIDVVSGFSECISNIDKELTTTIYTLPLVKGRKTPIYRASVRWKNMKPKTNSIFKKIEEWGIDVSAHHKRIPEFIFGLNAESIRYLLGAYTDTDSCLKNHNKIICVYKTVSKELCEGLQELIRLLGYSTQVYTSDTGYGTTAYSIHVDNAIEFLEELYDYSIKIQKKYKKEDLVVKRRTSGGLVDAKYIESILLANNISPRMTQRLYGISVRYKKYIRKDTIIQLNNIYKCFDDYLVQNDIVWSPILSITDDGVKMTYDLAIDEDHTFLINGLVVHNCDVIKFLQQICGLSGSEADNVRRAIARKQIDRLEAALPTIQEGYIAKSGKPRDEALNELQEYIQILIDSSSYMFGYNHSVAYCMIGYLCAYLRCYYTPYFIVSYLNNAANEDDIIGGFEMAKLYNIKILPPEFRRSRSLYVYDEATKSIYKGVSSVKFLNKGATEYLYSLRDNQYADFIDLLVQIEKDSKINSRQMEILIQIQYFKEFGKNKKLLNIYRQFKKLYGRKMLAKDKLEDFNLTQDDIKGAYSKETDKFYTDFDSLLVLKRLLSKEEDVNIPLTEQIEIEMNNIGYLSVTYDVDKKFCYVVSVDTKYSPKIELYSLGNGTIVQCKINKKVFSELPIKAGDIIYCNRFYKKNKQKKTADGWEETSEKEWWLADYELKTENDLWKEDNNE